MPAFDSSVIKFARYDALTRELHVRLVSGAYVYEDVPAKIYQDLLDAPSKGAFYNTKIRDRFSYKR